MGKGTARGINSEDVLVHQHLEKAVEGQSHHAPDDEAQVVFTPDEVIGDPEGSICPQ